MTDGNLDAAYRQAVYRVILGGSPLDLRVDQACGGVRALLTERGVDTAAFVTACNPGSRRLDRAANRAARTALEDAVAAMGCSALPGVAIDPEGRWPDEESLLLPGVDFESACSLARRFGQNALVWIGPEAVPELVWVATRRGP